jgi:hypothetical protein
VGQVLELRGQTDVWYQVFHPGQEINGWVYSGLTKTVKTKPLKQAGEPKKKGEKGAPKETEDKTESKPKKAPKSDKENESGSDSKKSDKPRSL